MLTVSPKVPFGGPRRDAYAQVLEFIQVQTCVQGPGVIPIVCGHRVAGESWGRGCLGAFGQESRPIGKGQLARTGRECAPSKVQLWREPHGARPHPHQPTHQQTSPPCKTDFDLLLLGHQARRSGLAPLERILILDTLKLANALRPSGVDNHKLGVSRSAHLWISQLQGLAVGAAGCTDAHPGPLLHPYHSHPLGGPF